ncbi:hypothetical protein VNO77_26788 [Canavalia gladiata]|uniref:Uncharacterized protein n=1 Tax=Canavalia gladiata TaxID=3824 RepID=A0AAN9KSZ8_CANGL
MYPGGVCMNCMGVGQVLSKNWATTLFTGEPKTGRETSSGVLATRIHDLGSKVASTVVHNLNIGLRELLVAVLWKAFSLAQSYSRGSLLLRTKYRPSMVTRWGPVSAINMVLMLKLERTLHRSIYLLRPIGLHGMDEQSV